MAVYSLYFDGAATKEPLRTASFGYVLKLNNQEVDKGYGVVGQGKFMTELVGEYYGLSAGLDSFLRHWDKPHTKLKIFGDSKYALSQVKKELHESDVLNAIALKLKQIRGYGTQVTLQWVPRTQNKVANDLAKKLRSLQ